jgi:general stress protein 26
MPTQATDSELLAEAVGIVNDAFLGMLTTVDADGAPHARWMGAAAMGGGLREIYTLCGRDTRKVTQITNNPNVCWVFSNDDHTGVVTLHGRAEILSAPMVSQKIWDRLVDCARTWAMNALSDDAHLEFVTVKTVVSRVEILSPRRKIFAPRSILVDG